MKFLRIFWLFTVFFGVAFGGAFAAGTGTTRVTYSFVLNDGIGSGGKTHDTANTGLLDYTNEWGWYDTNNTWHRLDDLAAIPTVASNTHKHFAGYKAGDVTVINRIGQFAYSTDALAAFNTNNTQLIAQWPSDKFRILLNDAGGSGGQVSNNDGAQGLYEVYGECYQILYLIQDLDLQNARCASAIYQTPTRTGYNFKGYYSGQNGSGTQIVYENGDINTSANTVFTTNNSTIYAKWEPRIFTVTLNHQSPTNSPAPSTVYLKYATNWYSNSAATTLISSMTTVPIKTNYDFGGYWTGTNGSGTQVIDSNGNFLTTTAALTAITSNTTIYAKWTAAAPAVYTVTLNPNGGNGSNHAIYYSNGNYYCDTGVTQTIASNASVFTTCGFSAPTLTNNLFDGYYSNTSAGTQYIDTDGKLTTAARNLVLNARTTWYAQYQATCNSAITLDPNGGNFSGTCANEFYPYYDSTTGQWMTPTLNTGCKPTLAGYTFMGYHVTNQNGVKYYDSNLNIDIPVWGLCSQQKVELVAEWTGNCNEITFDDNNGMTSVNANNTQHKRTGSPDWWGVNATPSDPCGKIYEGTNPTVNVPSSDNVPAHATFTGYYTTRDTGGSMIFNTSGAATTYGTNTWIISAPTTLYARWECDTGYEWNPTTHACDQNTFSVKYMCYNGDTTGKTDQATATNYTVRAMNWYEQCNINNNNPVPDYKWRFSGDGHDYSAGDTISNWMYGNDKTFVPSYTATFNCDTNYWQTPSGGTAPASQSVVLGDSIIMPGMSCEVKPEFDGWLETNYTWKTSYTQDLTTPVPGATCATSSNDLHLGPGNNFNWLCPTDLIFEPLVKFVNKPITVSCGVGGNTQTFNMTLENQSTIEQDIIDWYATACTGACPLTNPNGYPQGYNRKLVCAMNWGTQNLPTDWVRIDDDTQGRTCYKTGAGVSVSDILDIIDVSQITDLAISAVSYCPKHVNYKCNADATDVYNEAPYAVFEKRYTVLTNETVGCPDSGYEFTDWIVEGTDTHYTVGTIEQWPYEDEVTLVAQWGDANTYTITYKPNYDGATEPDVTQSVTYGATFTTKPAGTFHRPGYEMTAWVSGPNQPNTPYPELAHTYTYVTASDVNLFAQWEMCATGTYSGATQCTNCPDEYPLSVAGASAIEQCYKNCSVPCTTVACPANSTCTQTDTMYNGTQYYGGACNAVPQNCEITEIICNAGFYLDGAVCEPCTNGTTSPAGSTSANQCSACPDGQYVDNETCTDCPDGFDHSDANATSQSQCYHDCETPCTEPECPANSTSCTYGTAPNSGAWYFGTDACNATPLVCPIESVTCAGGYGWNPTNNTCEPCTGNEASINNSCEPCQDGKQPNADHTACEPCPDGTAGTNGTCEPCAPGYVPNAQATACVPCPAGTYWENGICEPCPEDYSSVPGSVGLDACFLADCPTGQHIAHGACEDDVIICDAPHAASATRTWNPVLRAYGSCLIQECDEDYHIASNACVPDNGECIVAHGRGERVWNGTAWDTCEITQCDPGYTVNNAGTACERCPNYMGADDQPAVSSYITGCEIASCMYQGQKYALEDDQCVPICEDDSDDTGAKHWDENLKRCVRTCNPGYKMW